MYYLWYNWNPTGYFKTEKRKIKGFCYRYYCYHDLLCPPNWREALGETGMLSPATGAWMSNLILGVTGVYMLIMTAKEKSLVPACIRHIGIRIFK